MPHLDYDGLRLHYTLHGLGGRGAPTIVLLHGLGSCGDDWLFQLPTLTPRYPVLTLDLPGHGGSSLPRGGFSTAALARPVAGLLGSLSLTPAHVVGLSLGGVVALQLALDAPSKVRSLVLVNSFARLSQPPRSVLRGLVRVALLLAAPMSWTGAWVGSGLFPRPDQRPLREAAAQRIASNSRAAYLRMMGAVLRSDLSGRLGEIRVPTLVVAGSEDRTVPLPAKVGIARGIEGARLEVIEGSGHATPIDAAEAFNSLLLEFLDGIERD